MRSFFIFWYSVGPYTESYLFKAISEGNYGGTNSVIKSSFGNINLEKPKLIYYQVKLYKTIGSGCYRSSASCILDINSYNCIVTTCSKLSNTTSNNFLSGSGILFSFSISILFNCDAAESGYGVIGRFQTIFEYFIFH